MRFNPPFTGNTELDSFLADLSRYVSDLNVGVTEDTGTGTVNTGGSSLAFLYQYLHIKYANDAEGTGFSDSQINKLYYGLYNSDDPVESTNWSDYTWYATTFGPTKKLWYKTVGGRQIQLIDSIAQPSGLHEEVPPGSIDLDILTFTIGENSITNGMMTDNSIGSAEIQAGAVGTSELADDSVTEPKLAASGVPSSTTYLNGLMQWASVSQGLFLQQTIVANEARNLLNTEGAGHHYHPASDANTVMLSIPNTSLYSYPIGTTYTFINMSAQPILIRSDNATLQPLNGTGTATYAYNINLASKVTMTYVATGKWVYSVDGGTATAIADPGPPGLVDSTFNFTADAYTELNTTTGTYAFA